MSRATSSVIGAGSVALAIILMLATASTVAATYSNTRTTAGQTYSPERSVSFAAGTHTGYKFDAYGAQTGSKAATLPSSSSAPASHRRYINSTWWYFITAGIWDGYWVPDNANINAAQGDSTVSASRTVNATVNWAGNSANPGTITIYFTQSAGNPNPATATSCGTLSPAAQNGNYHTKTCTVPSDGTWKFFSVGVGEGNPGSYDSTVFIDSVDPTTPSIDCTSCDGVRQYQEDDSQIFIRTAGLVGSETINITAATTDAAPSSGIEGMRFNALSPATGWSYGQTTPFTDTTSAYTEELDFTSSAVSTTQTIYAWDDAMNQSATRTLDIDVDNTEPGATWSSPSATTFVSNLDPLEFDWSETDAGAGFAEREVWVESAELTDGNCGSFSTDPTSSEPATSDLTFSAVADDTCYRLKLTATDNLGNSANNYSPAFAVDTTGPTHSAGSDASGASTAHQIGNTIWFNDAVIGEVEWSVDGTDAQSGIAGSLMDDSRLPADFNAEDPTDFDTHWSISETGFTVDFSSENNSGLTSTPETFTFSPDSTDPSVTATAPAAGTALSDSDDITVTWTESDADSGVSGRSVQRQKATASGGSCGTFSNDGSPTMAASPRQDDGLPSDFCYRYVVTVADNVGRTSSATSGAILVDTEEPGGSFSVPATPGSGELTWDADGDLDVTWTEVAPASGITARSLQHQTAPFTGVNDCGTFTNAGSPVTTASPVSATVDGATCHRWVLTLTSGADVDGVITSPAVALADTTDPTISFDAPIADLRQPVSAPFELEWTESDGGVIVSRSLQREVAAAEYPDACATATFTNDGSATSAGASPHEVTDLEDGNCYRWTLTVTDAAGNDDADTSAILYTDPAPTSTAEFTHPADDTETLFFSDFTDPDSHVGWPGTRTQQSGGNWVMDTSAGNQTNNTKYGPLLPASAGETYRLSGHFTSSGAGAISSVGLCFYDELDALISCAADIDTQDIDFNVLRISVALAPVGTAQLSFRVYDRFTTTSSDDVLIEHLTTSEAAAVQVADSVDVAWAETTPPHGLPISARSLQRQAAEAESWRDCGTVQWIDDGAPVVDDPSPVLVEGLQPFTCYRWRLFLTDGSGNVGVSTSGVIFTVSHQLSLQAAPQAMVGSTAQMSVVVVGPDEEPRSDYRGELTISTSDVDAVFPEGPTYLIAGPEDLVGHTFPIVFASPGEHTVTVVGENAQGDSSTVTVIETQLAVTAPATAYIDVPFLLGVDPQTLAGLPNPRYSATVEFASSDPSAQFQLPLGGDEYTFSCNCDAGQSFPVRLFTEGVQTITVADQFGNSTQVSVEVLPAPSAIPSPIDSLYVVQWRHGAKADLYLTASASAAPFSATYAIHSCIPGSFNGEGIGLTVDPAVDRHVEFTIDLPDLGVNRGWCPGVHLSGADVAQLIITDGVGHKWAVGVDGSYLRFDAVPDGEEFRQLNAGDPIASMETVSRANGGSLTGGEGQEKAMFSSASLALEFVTHSAVQTTELAIGRPGIHPYTPVYGQRLLPAGASIAHFDEYTHGCHTGPSWGSLASGWLRYTDSSGYAGAFAHGGGGGAFIDEPPATTADPAICIDPADEAEDLDLPGFLDALNPSNWPFVGAMARFLAADPVDPFSGGFTQPVTDFSLGGLSPSLQLTRTYRSDRAERAAAGDATAAGILGPGWGSSVDQRLFISGGGTRVEWRAADGGVSVFTRAAGGGDYSGVRSDITLTESSGAYQLESNAGSVLHFDSAGRLTASEDQAGREMTFVYDGTGHLESVTDAANRTAEFTVNGSGRVTRVDLPDGRYVAYTYADGHMATARSVSGTVVTYVTDSRGRLTEIRSSTNDLLLQNAYDDRGRVVSQVSATGQTTRFVYDPDALMTQVIDPRGAITTDCFLASGQLSDRIDALGNTTSHTYDFAGNPASSTDALGLVTTFECDANGLATSVTDPLGRTQTIAYDDKLVSQVTDHRGNTVTPTYDTSDRATSVTRAEPASDPDPQSLVLATFTYNAMGLPETISEPGGAEAILAYDTAGYLIGVTDAEGRQITYTIDARGFVTAIVDPLGNATGGTPAEHTSSYTHDNAGRVLTATNATDETTTYTYDEMGRLATTTSPLGTETTNTYDDDGRLLSTTTELSDTETATTTFDYDAAGNLARVTDAEDRQTEFEYDLLGRQILQRDPNGEEWLTDYDALGRVTRTTDPTGETIDTFYDIAGRVSKTVDSAGEETTFSYNDVDQLVTIVDPLGRETTNTYDWLGRQTQFTNAEEETTVSAFNDAGDLISITDAEGQATTFTYDETHRLLEVIDAALGETAYTYDAAGRLTERTNARDKSETFEYDAVGRQTLATDALGNEWETYYDDDGRVDFTIDGKGQTTEFTFDRGGRLLSVDPAGAMAPITYTYDDTGRQLTMSDPEGTSTFGYDNTGRITSAARDSQTVGYTYDAAGRPTSVIYPGSSGSVDYTYDSAGRLATIEDWAGRTTTTTYDDASRVISLARPGSLTTNFAYDDVDRLLGIDHLQGSTALLELDYTYDDVGNVLTYTDDSGAATFGYNDLHQLTSADYPGANDFAYSYDAVGNMTQMAGPTGTFDRTFNDGDQLIDETLTGSLSETVASATATGAWTDMTNLAASDDADATAAPAAASTVTMAADDFDFASVPIDALISEVNVSVEWASSLSTAELTLGAQARVDGTLVGTETTETGNPATDAVASFEVEGLDRADLELLTIDIRATRVAGDPVTASVDTVTVEVIYTLPPRSFTYDDDGSMTDDGAGRTFAYDAMGRLTGVEGTVDATYTYDGSGSRISAAVDSVTTDFVVDVRGMGTVLSDGTNRFLPGGPNGGYEAGGVWVNALTNHQGTVLGYADGAGLVGSLTHFDPYGSPLPGSTAPATGPGYTGEWTDATGLVNLRFRSYDPTLQSFFGRDTFAGAASAPLSGNRYAYALGNPLRYTDPSGHFIAEFMRHPGLYISIGLQFVPIIGDAYGFATGFIGYDPIAGVQLTAAERALSIGAGLLAPGGGFHLLDKAAARASDDAASIAGRSGARASRGMKNDAGGFGPMAASPRAGFRTPSMPVSRRGTARAIDDATGSSLARRADDSAEELEPVFWSGGAPAERAAVDWAGTNGGITLRQTSLGRTASATTEGMEWVDALPHWEEASRQFAESAAGPANVFQSVRGVGVNSIWGRVEYPILIRNDVDVTYHIVMKDGSFHTLR